MLEFVIPDLYQLLLHGVYDVSPIGLRNKPNSVSVRGFSRYGLLKREDDE